MIEWSEEHLAIRDAFRKFIDAEIRPNIEELEHGDTPPYEVLRKLYKTFGIAEMQLAGFKAQIEREKKAAAGDGEPKKAKRGGGGDSTAAQMLLLTELCRVCPGMVTAMGVSVSLTAGTIMSKGTIAQKERFAPALLTMEKIGAWAITEPGSGSDAFGSMVSSCKRADDGGYILNGSKTFITNGPYADTIIFIAKFDDGETPADKRQVLSFVLDRGTKGLTQSKPLRKMGQHSSPTGELFLEDVHVPADRLLGESETRSYRTGAKDTFGSERSGTPPMALGIVEECLSLCVEYAKTRVQFGQPIGQFQLIQQKLAKMEVARMNIQNLVFRIIEGAELGKGMSFAEASAAKLYSAQAAMEVALEAVQLHGGNGYMAEYRVEQLCRDAKVLQIYAGTDEIQTSQIARSLMAD